jgi:transcriptional regulator with PAS, ATPase and Fis domain
MNGVQVNGTRVSEAALSINDVIRVGEWIGVIVSTDPMHSQPGVAFTFEHGLVAGPALRPPLDMAKLGASTDLPIVIQGESGTGKELVARAVHLWSARPGPFLAVNCAALPEALAEAMLFGHRKGAFTGAVQDSRGHFRAAQGGTLLLDEVADLPVALQAKLLRAIEQGEVIPVGEATPVQVDVRVLAATQVPLSDQVRDRTFRRDLAARLDGITIVLPPLRDRIEEIPHLFDWFLRKHGGTEPPRPEPCLIEALCLYDWPSNVRELEHLVRRLIGLSAGESRLRVAQLPEQIRASSGAAVSAEGKLSSPDGFGARDARDLAMLTRSLRVHGGNVARAAAASGISRQRAYRLLDAHPELNIDAMRRHVRAEEDDAAEEGREPE